MITNSQGVIIDYANLWMIWDGHCYLCRNFWELADLENNFLEAVALDSEQ